MPLIDGPRENTLKPPQSNQPPGQGVKITIGGVNLKLKNERQNKTPGKIEERSEKKRDKPSKQSPSEGDKTPVAVGHHEVPPFATPRSVACLTCFKCRVLFVLVVQLIFSVFIDRMRNQFPKKEIMIMI